MRDEEREEGTVKEVDSEDENVESVERVSVEECLDGHWGWVGYCTRIDGETRRGVGCANSSRTIVGNPLKINN